MPIEYRLFILTVLTACFAHVSVALAQAPSFFEGADLQVGQKLIADLRCNACHAKSVGGDGVDIYNPQGRINTPGKLRGMVEACNTQLNLALFPDEVNSIAAVLNNRHYKFVQ